MNRSRLTILSLLYVLSFSYAASADSLIPIGAAKVNVTPKHPVVLAGYGGRVGEFDGIDTQLWARALVIGEETPLALVVLDNCGVPTPIVDKLAQRLARHGLTKDRLVVSATHTHNAPTLVGYAPIVWAGRTTPEQDAHVAQYTEFVVDRMERAVVNAMRARTPLAIEWTQGRLTFGRNRRVLSQGKWVGFGIQRNRPVDHSLPILAARDAKGAVRVVWTNYACHCTTAGSQNSINGDWAGFANSALEQQFPQAVALTTIGCGADVGPQPSGNLDLAKQHGRALAAAALDALNGDTKRLTVSPTTTSRTIKLPFATTYAREHWDEQLTRGSFHGELAKAILARLEKGESTARDIDYRLSMWKFGRELAVVFLGGEVVVDYSVRLNRELDWRRLWINGWSNGMPGYIPSRRILEEGGYEADFSQVYYGQPSRYAPEIENQLISAVKGLAGETFAAKPDAELAPFHRLPSGEADAFRRLAQRVRLLEDEADKKLVEAVRSLAAQSSPAVDTLTVNEGKSTEWFNYAGDFAERLFIRQTAKGTRLEWKTPAVESGQPAVLCFMGGIGWRSQPKTAGFALTIDGADCLQFDVTHELSRWSSDDDDVQLVFLPTWTSDEDAAGFFFVRIAANRLTNQTLRLGVRSLGESSQRWFAVDVAQDVPRKLRKLIGTLSDN